MNNNQYNNQQHPNQNGDEFILVFIVVVFIGYMCVRVIGLEHLPDLDKSAFFNAIYWYLIFGSASAIGVYIAWRKFISKLFHKDNDNVVRGGRRSNSVSATRRDLEEMD